ncbi:replication initiator protein A [Variovorax sp.]|jgi:plasmid replication initiation protein|uniref:replication initiator protein A n=1 Tax=Variovorax sp. TaxID=1871043 RepID=UPI0037D9F2D5
MTPREQRPISMPSTQSQQLALFRALPEEGMAPRDAQDLMAYPFFSLAKSRRLTPIRFEAGDVSLVVEGVPEHGIATIWDADVLIWAASQIVEARDAGLQPSRLLAAAPHQILRFARRGTGSTDYRMLRAALDRLQSTTVATSIRQAGRRQHRFSWLSEWREHVQPDGRSSGVELVLADWFFNSVMDEALVLTLDAGYFGLTGGIERWLYRLVRKHGGRQSNGWRFALRLLHRKSGSLQRYSDFALQLRHLVRRQSLPGYLLTLERHDGLEWLHFRHLSTVRVGKPGDNLCVGSGDRPHAARGIDRTTLGESDASSRAQPAARVTSPRA